jgi:hypothetical protein
MNRLVSSVAAVCACVLSFMASPPALVYLYRSARILCPGAVLICQTEKCSLFAHWLLTYGIAIETLNIADKALLAPCFNKGRQHESVPIFASPRAGRDFQMKKASNGRLRHPFDAFYVV